MSEHYNPDFIDFMKSECKKRFIRYNEDNSGKKEGIMTFDKRAIAKQVTDILCKMDRPATPEEIQDIVREAYLEKSNEQERDD